MNWHNDSVTSLFRACTSIVTQKWNIFPTPGRVLLIQLYDVKLVFVDEPPVIVLSKFPTHRKCGLSSLAVRFVHLDSQSKDSWIVSLKSQNWVNFFHEWISFNLLQNMSKRIGMVQFGLDRKGSRHTTDTFSHFDISDLKEILGMFHKVTWNTVSFFFVWQACNVQQSGITIQKNVFFPLKQERQRVNSCQKRWQRRNVDGYSFWTPIMFTSYKYLLASSVEI